MKARHLPHVVLPAGRSRLLAALLVLSLAGLAGRAAYLQGIHNDFLQEKGESRYSRVLEMNANRGMITDRNGEPLAISTPVESVWCSPQDMNATPEQMKKLANLIDLDVGEVRKRVNVTQHGASQPGSSAGSRRDFVYLKRHLSPDIASKVVELNIPGVFLKREYRRYYPAGELTAHVLGFTDVDDKGQEGVELAWQDELAGKPGSRRVIRDRKGRIVEDVESIRAPKPGQNVALSIDGKIQYLAYRELKQAVEANKAKAGGIIVLDAKTGEILALVNLPVYNPNNRKNMKGGRARNRALTDEFEPGSTLKPFTIAAALETGGIKPDTVLETAPGTFTIGKATIRDAHKEGALTVSQVIQKSSNVGSAKIALSLPPQTLWEMLNDVGFGTPTGSGFPGEVSGKLRPYRTWRPIEQATMSYGHGIAVSLLQLARAYTLFSAEGELKPVSLLRLENVPEGKRVISRNTALAVSEMLELVAQPGGTATQARINGYRVAGKTGTAHKLEGNGYAKNRYLSTFVGYAPASNPRFVIAVMLDEPSAGQYFGGAVAAPVFSRVMAGALRMLNVPHDAPVTNVVSLTAAPKPPGDA
ncbi:MULTISPECIES: peptidoglycan D,D-transpeptidase FtsI family protein [unclassified Nitrosospira]|uniref:peptidoglycan D,D-transpeptidase FtsI family protein n=1 Tax=unclassified Nitrosospira TaxID=2609267 RepID=UPI000D30C3EF|nr:MULTISPECIES: penicillin-binding protein 2 [unclassified Nitrosospira]PTR15200.1 peptidoglycan synthetase FtsI [Nitrosospira sp. Nsp2]WON72708.1 penicillin-binding protein 2 [Nitrosospira sp. Is2]